jgi:hypothetical protein
VHSESAEAQAIEFDHAEDRDGRNPIEHSEQRTGITGLNADDLHDQRCAPRPAQTTGNLFCAVIVLIASGLQPDCFSFLSECHCQIGKTTVWGCAVPMLDSRSAFNYISLANDARGLPPFLIVASTFGDQQNLTARMTMPIQLCTSLIGFSSCTPQVDLLYTEPYGSV